jgi:hypothetical protein
MHNTNRVFNNENTTKNKTTSSNKLEHLVGCRFFWCFFILQLLYTNFGKKNSSIKLKLPSFLVIFEDYIRTIMCNSTYVELSKNYSWKGALASSELKLVYTKSKYKEAN